MAFSTSVYCSVDSILLREYSLTKYYYYCNIKKIDIIYIDDPEDMEFIKAATANM
jgi:hypothetical protein